MPGAEARQQDYHLAIIPIRCDEPARVEGGASHAARFLPLPRLP
jgi:hypothetical protein